ncbi:hypothetical protein K469DRAFT_551076 [Zopfia rhizophila CBS 207.26]|uniref:BTB domain-containing protein n=1 Tax=Zopfia rhizophila CBS 207.26 TaxID=1314779 RepID=A0A6A6EU08_9PEZI|nr:hypothetical protein K469DRAFT_551076 [Zopfia rhizophila CBS 207.26]
MSGYLWKYYLEDDVVSFRHVLENASHTTRPGTQKSFAGWQGGSLGAVVNSSPGSYGGSPLLNTKGRKAMGLAGVSLTRSDVNSRDGAGMTILHHASSSSSDNATGFAQALLEHPLTDLYIQDAENGWTSLHRAFYFGNIAIARLILNRDTRDILGHGSGGFNQHARGLIKIKDKEGYGPLDLFAMTIKDRTLGSEERLSHESDSDDEVTHGDSGDRDDEGRKRTIPPPILLGGNEVYTFGSNKNITLGFGDEDDRQFPERITLRRPDHLLQRFYREHQERLAQTWSSMNLPLQHSGILQAKAVADLPIHIRNTPIVIQDVQMSKLHTAVLTTDPVSNLYICGHGPGGRLGTGSETTRYLFTCIEGGGLAQKKVAAVALGQNHTLAISEEGEIFSWGNNAFGQLGYTLPKPNVKDDDPISTLPRQIFGPLKRETVTGIAASRIHSVAHTATSLYTFGKNEGQLGIVDSDARSLEVQIVPRKIAASLFSSPIASASAIDGATTCLLENREVWVFANYGYARLNFPLEGFTNYFLKESWRTTKYHTSPNKISRIISGGDTICAMSTSGEVYTVAVSRRSEQSLDANTSTTNPKQIRGALSQPYRIWSAKRGHMAARDVDVDQDGSIILTTEAGSVWRRTKRATIKNATAAGAGEHKPKDYKFLRVPGLTRVIAVRSSAFGAYAAIRKDCDVTKTQVGVDEPSLWKDVAPLLSFNDLSNYEETSDDDDPSPRFWQRPSNAQSLRKRALKSKDLETEVSDILRQSLVPSQRRYDMELATTTSDVRIPVHEFIFSGRSRVLRDAMLEFRTGGNFDMPDIFSIKQDDGKLVVLFRGLEFLTIFNLALYLYTDSIVDFWNVTRQFPKLAFRYRSVRTELMKVALRLELRQLEPAVRQMVNPRRSLKMDMELAVKDLSLFESGDVVIELADGEILLHSDMICQRCPFFEGLFRGRAGGQWLAGRREDSEQIRIDLKHVGTHLFELIVRHIYADAGEDLFDDVTSEDLNDFLALDELLDHIMDVMSVANELMLDRLSQICQRLIGRYVNARNVCSLLNAIAPSSVAEFKDAALEYVCLSLEAVMQNGSLDELDEDLLLELNQVVRDNQLATLPFARSGRAETLLFDKHPELAETIERAKRAKIDSVVLSNKFSDGGGMASTSFRAQSLEELSTSPLRHRTRRKASRETKTETDSPSVTPALNGKGSVPDLIFEMSDGEDEELEIGQKIQPPRFTEHHATQKPIGSPEETWSAVRRMSESSSHGLGVDVPASLQLPSLATSGATKVTKPPGQPWGAKSLGGAKLDLRDIMAQASTDRTSNLTLGLSRQAKEERPSGSFHTKMSQKERKRLQQAQQLGQPTTLEKPQPAPLTVSPWQAVSQRRPIPSGSPAVASSPQPSRTPSTPQLTMRQTIANTKQRSPQPPSPPSRTASSSAQPSQNRPGSSSGPGMSVSTHPISTPHSVRHIPLPSHSPTSPSQHLTMMEILSQQEAEKNYIKDAAAKRSLQEIQQEQEFQEWWDQESKRVMLEEEQRKRAEERAAKSARGRSRGRGGRGKGKGREKNDGEEEGDGTGDGERGKGSRSIDRSAESKEKVTPKQEGGEKGKGRGKEHRGGKGSGRGGKDHGPARDSAAATTS